MNQVDEEHLNVELNYILKNKNIEISENIKNYSKEIKYGFLIFKYINLLKEESKKQENIQKELLKNFNLKDNIIINIEYDLNKIEIEKERIKNLKDEELFKEALIKIKSTNNADNLKYFIESKDKNLDDFINNSPEIFINNEEFKKFCFKFLNDYAHIKIIENKIIEKEMIISDDSKNNDFEIKNNGELPSDNGPLKDIETKSLEELLKETYVDNKIDIKKLLENFLINKYDEKYTNINDLFKKIISDNTNLILSIEEFLEKISSNDKYKNEFKDYLLLIKKEDYLKEHKKKPESYKIIKNIKLDDINNIYSFIVINDIIAVLVDDNLRFYNSKTLELIQNLKFNFGNKIIKLKQGNIIGKIADNNYAIFINPSNLTNKKKYFSNFNGKTLGTETYDEKIILIGNYELYI